MIIRFSLLLFFSRRGNEFNGYRTTVSFVGLEIVLPSILRLNSSNRISPKDLNVRCYMWDKSICKINLCAPNEVSSRFTLRSQSKLDMCENCRAEKGHLFFNVRSIAATYYFYEQRLRSCTVPRRLISMYTLGLALIIHRLEQVTLVYPCTTSVFVDNRECMRESAMNFDLE